MKTYLKVPYKNKDKAKSLGALWDNARKLWYVENLENLKPFLKWMPSKLKEPTTSKPLEHPKFIKPRNRKTKK